MVVLFHAGFPLPGGFTGVDVFFVISGFVITNLLIRELRSTGRIDFVRFYARRIRRLLPALATMVAATTVLGWFLLPLASQHSAGRTGVAAGIFLANFEIMRSTGGYFDNAAEQNPLLHTWSLSVEEQFYLVFPALLLLGWAIQQRWKKGRHAPALVVTTVLLASLGASVWLTRGWGLSSGEAAQELAFYSSFTRAWQFGAGSLLAVGWPVVAVVRQRVAAWTNSVVAWVAAVALAGVAFTVDGTGYPGLSALAPTLATVLLIATADADRGVVGRTLSSRPFVAIGDLSYSLYLWHWPALVLSTTLITDPRVRTNVLIVIASTVPAYASFRWIETPLRRRSISHAQRIHTFRLAAVCVTVPVTLAAALAWGSDHTWFRPEIAQWESLRQEKPVGRALGCHSDPLDEPPAPASCVFGEGDRGLVLLVGDSHAAALGDSIVGALDQEGYRTVILSVNGCPFLANSQDWHPWVRSGRVQPCSRGLAAQWGAIESMNPDAVVIANSSAGYVRNSPVVEDNGIAVKQWGNAIHSTLLKVAEHGLPVLLVHQVPDHPSSLALCTRSWGVDHACVESPHGEIASARMTVVTAERDAVDGVPGAVSWDPAVVLCSALVCSRESAGKPIYLDDTHVNPSARLVLAAPLRDNLMQLLP